MKTQTHTPCRFAALLGLALTILAPATTFAAFGIVDSGGFLTVDTGAGLVFKVKDAGGDITSIRFNGGPEMQDQTKGSHIASGIGATVTWGLSPSGSTGTITLTAGDLIHYLIVRKNDNTIYMATWTGPNGEPSVGELRWITRIIATTLPNAPIPSNLTGNTGAIESADIFGLSNGQTRSKYYGNQQAKDLTIRGATGSGVGVFMVYGSRESSSGGPFYRDIQNQTGGDTEIYNYMNSGHNQTEAYRLNVLHGPYALIFTTGATPAIPDFSFMSYLPGWVAGRGTVHGTATGNDSGTTAMVGFANSTAQYWANVSGGNYTCSGMKPGTYTMSMYQGELVVATSSVAVTSGGNVTKNIASTLSHPTTIWKIGTWDGTPKEFLNGNNISQMHPQDVRNASWGPVTFTVGSTSTGSFPALQLRADNSPTTIKFNLTSAQVAAHTLRIGITCAYNSGRPSVVINGHATTNPGASSQPNSRSYTTGQYRGNNALFTYSIPASSFVVGTNTLTITPISGSSDLGTWLCAAWAYDCVEFDI